MPYNPNPDQLNEYFETNMARYLDILKQMVSINSFTSRPEGVDQLGKLTIDIFGQLGFVAESVPSANRNYGQHLFLTRPGANGSKSPTIGLVSHLDTVYPPEDEQRNNFSWRVEGDRVYGPGTIDIKGGTLMIYMILEYLQTSAPQVFEDTTWMILMDAAEEALEPDFGRLCRQRLPEDALACLVFEGGRHWDKKFSIVTSRKGMATFEIDVEGKAAHAGSAHKKGANAIVQLAHTISRISELTDYGNGITFNVGNIEGGTVTNRVPHRAFAGGEMRAFSQDELEKGISRLLALQDDVQVYSLNGSYRCDVNVRILQSWRPWPSNEGSKHLLSFWQEAAKSLDFEVTGAKRGGLSDGNFLWDHLPTIDGLGPAGGNAHCSERSQDGSKDQEYVRISSF
ncbi:MAG: M20/M25/M40 family metallo-hydrolase, partial [Chloroflexota bacterium]